MKFFRTASAALVALVLCLCVLPVFAGAASVPLDTYAPEAGEVLTDDVDSPPSAGDEPVLDNSPSDTGADGSGSSLSSPSSVFCSGSDVTVYLDDRSYTSVVDVAGNIPVNASVDSGTLPGFLRSMFGEYTPKTQTVSTYFDGQLLGVSTEYVPGIAGMDMEWIASVVLFGVVLYCLFRMLGGMVR